ncbi:hypothetical protein LG326_03500 [Metaplanococcus flavidus]
MLWILFVIILVIAIVIYSRNENKMKRTESNYYANQNEIDKQRDIKGKKLTPINPSQIFEKENETQQFDEKVSNEFQSQIDNNKTEEIDLKGNIIYDNRQAITFDNGWTHTFSYNDERLRFESRKYGILQTCGDHPIEFIKRVELMEGENRGYELLRVFFDIYTDMGRSRLFITDKRLINDNLDFLEEIVWKINNEILLNKQEGFYF